MDGMNLERGNPAGDPSGGIPAVVPKMPFLFVPFPSKVFIELVFNLNSQTMSPDQFLEYLKALVASKYVLAIITLPFGEFGVGVLGRVRHLKKLDDGKVLVSFRGIERAKYIYQGFDEENNLGLVRRLNFSEIPVSNELGKNNETLMQIEELRNAFREFCERFSLAELGGGHNYFRIAEVLIEEATPLTIKETIDAVALVISHMNIGISLLLPVYVILREPNVGIRLRNLIDLLKILLRGLLIKDDWNQETGVREALVNPADDPVAEIESKPEIDAREPLSTKKEKEMAEKGLKFLENAERIRQAKLYKKFEVYYQEHKKKKK